MKFLKNFFDDNSVKVGLCSFKSLTPRLKQQKETTDVFFNPFERQANFVYGYETNFTNNVLLAR